MILKGALKVGDSLPTELTLCEQFGVNRSSVREGIRLLEESGMLRRVSSKRMVVSRPTAQEMSEQLERGLTLHEVTFLELWELAMAIEPMTASLAATHLVPADIEALDANLKASKAVIGDTKKLTLLDVEFHTLISSSVHNRILQLTRGPMVRLFYPAFEVVLKSVPASRPRLLKAHQMIVSALEAGDSVAASNWMEKHMKDFRLGFELAGLDLGSPAMRPKRRKEA